MGLICRVYEYNTRVFMYTYTLQNIYGMYACFPLVILHVFFTKIELPEAEIHEDPGQLAELGPGCEG